MECKCDIAAPPDNRFRPNRESVSAVNHDLYLCDMKEVDFMTYTAFSRQGATKMVWPHFMSQIQKTQSLSSIEM